MKHTIKRLCFTALFLAIGLLLPFLTGQIQQIGNMLLPMHLPVFLCGMICGWPYGLLLGAVLPLLRSALFFMPPLYPVAIAMAAELATYGLISGFLYPVSARQVSKKTVWLLYRTLLVSMVAGRAVWGLAELLLLGIGENGFTAKMFLSGAFLTAIPGILLQLVLIPAIMAALTHAGLIPLREHMQEHTGV